MILDSFNYQMKQIRNQITRTEVELAKLRVEYAEKIRYMAKKASEYAAQENISDYRHNDIEADLAFVKQIAEKIKHGEVELLCYKNALFLAAGNDWQL